MKCTGLSCVYQKGNTHASSIFFDSKDFLPLCYVDALYRVLLNDFCPLTGCPFPLENYIVGTCTKTPKNGIESTSMSMHKELLSFKNKVQTHLVTVEEYNEDCN